MKVQKTTLTTPRNARREWILIDAADQVLGRLATRIAERLRGKHRAQYSPSVDAGDFIVVINAARVKLTGNKLIEGVRYRHSGYIGGLKETSPREMIEKNPAELIHLAVAGMMPKNRLSKQMMRKLRVFAGAEHSHAAQLTTVASHKG